MCVVLLLRFLAGCVLITGEEVLSGEALYWLHLPRLLLERGWCHLALRGFGVSAVWVFLLKSLQSTLWRQQRKAEEFPFV